MSRSPDQLHIRPGAELWLHLADKNKLRESLVASIFDVQTELSARIGKSVTLDYELSPYIKNLESKAVPSIYVRSLSDREASIIEVIAPLLGLSAKKVRFSKIGPNGYRTPYGITMEISFRSNRHRVVS